MNILKDHLRAEMKKRREVLAQTYPKAGDMLAQIVSEEIEALNLWPEPDAIIAGYWPIQSEINPLPLLQTYASHGYVVALPALIGQPDAANSYRMIFRTYSTDMTLRFGPFGISQPDESEDECLPDVIMTPLLAFDAGGNRLGYGGGYYDRALSFIRAEKRCMAIGLGFAAQVVDDLPIEPFDQPLDMIFTEQGIVRLD